MLDVINECKASFSSQEFESVSASRMTPFRKSRIGKSGLITKHS
jgi:hypothetical protein